MQKLTGKVAFVTGGSRGMGAAIARRLASEGADVVFTHSGKNQEKAGKVLAGIKGNGRRGMALVAGNEHPEELLNALKTTVDEYGRLDILVNNAGVYSNKLINEYSLEEYDQMMGVNVKAVFVAAQFAASHMKQGGRIITIGSNMADRVGFQGGSLYAMSKSALSGLTKAIARDLGPRNITANLIQPGPVDTDMNPADSDHAPALISQTTIGRYGTVAEIAGLVAYFAGEESQFITGAALTIDGGVNV